MKKLIIFFLLLFLNIPSKACSCVGESLINYEIKHSDILVTGKVVSIERSYIKFKNLEDYEKIDSFLSGVFLNKVSLHITSIYKGKRKMQSITIYTGIGGGDCGVRFKEGLNYIVYASKQNPSFSKKFHKENSKEFKESFWTDICTRTQKLNSDEIQKIHQIKKTKR